MSTGAIPLSRRMARIIPVIALVFVGFCATGQGGIRLRWPNKQGIDFLAPVACMQRVDVALCSGHAQARPAYLNGIEVDGMAHVLVGRG